VLTKIYWLRVTLGAIAGLVCTGVIVAWQSFTPSTTLLSLIGSIDSLFNGITIALAIYLVSYYVLKAKYASQVEKQSKILSMGIFIYFFTWLIAWVLSLTALIGPL
jgi:hypothetical protein